jgi:hypothetical protein
MRVWQPRIPTLNRLLSIVHADLVQRSGAQIGNQSLCLCTQTDVGKRCVRLDGRARLGLKYFVAGRPWKLGALEALVFVEKGG